MIRAPDRTVRPRPTPIAYRIDDAAAVIGVSRSKMWDLVRQGRVPARKLDGSTLFRHEDLLAFVDSLPEARPSEAAGVEFTPENGAGAGVRLRKAG